MQQGHEPVMSRVKITHYINEACSLELMVSSLLLEVLKSELHKVGLLWLQEPETKERFKS